MICLCPGGTCRQSEEIGRIRPIRLIRPILKKPYKPLILINTPADEFPDQRGG